MRFHGGKGHLLWTETLWLGKCVSCAWWGVLALCFLRLFSGDPLSAALGRDGGLGGGLAGLSHCCVLMKLLVQLSGHTSGRVLINYRQFKEGFSIRNVALQHGVDSALPKIHASSRNAFLKTCCVSSPAFEREGGF